MLAGIRVLQFQGLAPSVFCGMYFADQGAEVILVTRKDSIQVALLQEYNLMNRGKKCIALSPKIVGEREMIEELIRVSDVIIDPYRPGVLEKLGIGPEFIYRHNKQAVLLRVTGYGQTGPMSKKPGHDLNYISVSGIVPLINGHPQTTDQLYQFPTNFLADFVSCSLGITATLSALAISRKTGLGRIVDCSMAKGANYYSQIVKQSNPSSNYPEHQLLYLNSGQKEYCVIIKKSGGPCPKQIIKRMVDTAEQYLQSQWYSISRVKLVEELKKEITGMKNPFGNEEINGVMGRKLPSRNQHQKEIREYIEKIGKGRAKL